MSEPVTNVDIEDVLSSIRRLVTEESRGEVKRIKLNPQDAQPVQEESAKAVPAKEPKAFTRLLLTPSLRVVDDAPKDAERSETPEITQPAPPQEPWLDPNATLLDAATRMPAESEPAPEAAAPMATIERAPLMLSEAMARPTVEAEPEPEIADAKAPVPSAAEEAPKRRFTEPGMAAEHIVYTSKFAELRSRSDTLKSKIKALEAAIAETPGSWEPDGSGMDDNDQAPIETIPWQGHVSVPELTPEVVEETTSEAMEDDAVAAPETGVAEDADEASAETTEDVSEAVNEPAEDAAEVDEQDDLTADEQVEENVLDEAALRQLVAEIVREELQGALGERITRNVRKLVRLEIQRALAAHGLD
ncbi:hypothetical protein ACFO5X_24355 [Seohaeicola nanhaiensis]|uniref:DUF2497 domain-containing protein n=1 Tax=Seohaeicola nanhaiensis TaxID=1387282 RepID=A0ABV9KP36_9RHOB